MEFHDNDRMAVRDYYADLGHRGRCPPGLAKKHDRCMPPGQAKRWEIGRPLPRDVVYYNLPPELVVHLSPPPAGYRRSEEHTSELQSLMRISYAVFCLKKTKTPTKNSIYKLKRTS